MVSDRQRMSSSAYRRNMSPEQRAHYNEMARLRVRNWRLRQREQSAAARPALDFNQATRDNDHCTPLSSGRLKYRTNTASTEHPPHRRDEGGVPAFPQFRQLTEDNEYYEELPDIAAAENRGATTIRLWLTCTPACRTPGSTPCYATQHHNHLSGCPCQTRTVRGSIR